MNILSDTETSKALAGEASAWVVKLNVGKLSREEAFAFEDWLNESAAHRQVFNELAGVWHDVGDMFDSQEAGVREPLSLSRVLAAWARLNPVKTWGALTAACLLLVSVSWVVTSGLTPLEQPALAPMVLVTAVGENKTANLSDGSVVQLNTNTRLEIIYLPAERMIKLEQGEAHFDVAEIPSRPFRVYAGEGVIEAVGTAFAVQLKETSTEVIVTEGKVKLTRVQTSTFTNKMAATAAKETIATVEAGRNAVFDKALISVEEIDQNQVEKKLSWQKGMLLFDGDTLETAVREFERYTTTDMVILDEDIRNIRIIGYFGAGDTDKFLNALEASFQIAARPAGEGTVYLYRDPPQPGHDDG